MVADDSVASRCGLIDQSGTSWAQATLVESLIQPDAVASWFVTAFSL